MSSVAEEECRVVGSEFWRDGGREEDEDVGCRFGFWVWVKTKSGF